MRNVIRFALVAVIALTSVGGLFTPEAGSDPQCHRCSPYGMWCNDLATGQSYFCDDNGGNCVPVTTGDPLPEVNCKT